MIGELIDHYRVLELVGCGAMGVVYKALDENLERQVAIKVMGTAARNEPNFVERFRQEARLQAALNHPNIALLFDYFVHDGAPVAVMEFIDGESLEQLIRRRGRIPANECIPLFRQALAGVAAAHRAGIIHRDLKPSNLMVTRDGIVKVMDFGIARRQGVSGAATKVGSSTSIGSPLYMAPEQILGRAVDCRTDIYALGITLYELLSGQQPFNPRGKTEYSLLDAHVNKLPEPPTVHCRDIPGPVVDAVLRALAKEPEDRFQSADEFMRALPEVNAPSIAAALPADPGGTVTLEYSPPANADTIVTRKPAGTMAFEYAPSARRDPAQSVAFDYSAATLRQESYLRRSAPSPAAVAAPTDATRAASVKAPAAALGVPPPPPVAQAAPPGLMQTLRAHRPAVLLVVITTVMLGLALHRAHRLHGATRPSTVTDVPTVVQTPPAMEVAAPSPASPSPESRPEPQAAEVVATPPAVAATAAIAAATSRPDLSGSWSGEYVDSRGKLLLRVVNLSIYRVHNDGGIEGTLQYESGSGEGECKLHPHGSTYSAGARRLQLSPEGCSPRYPKELGVPFDFAGVSPWADTLRNGRVEAPTGDVIRVSLRRISGV
jgi:predicted Ser/Thr protein kinase